MINLDERTKKIIGEYEFDDNQKVSIYLKKLNGEEFLAIDEEEMVVSASCIKVAILVAVLEEVKNKKISLDKIIDFRENELIGYKGIYGEIEKIATLEELLTFMIIHSDNMATNVLIDLYGFDYYNNFFKEIGLTKTILNRHMGKYNLNKENYTSNKDMYTLFKQIFNYEILDKELCNLAMSMLKKQRSKKVSQRYIFQDIDVYLKDGALSYLGLKNDCGIFKHNNEIYYFGYFIQGAKNDEDSAIIIGRLFKDFYSNL